MFSLEIIQRLMKPSLRKPIHLAYLKRLLTRGKELADTFKNFKAEWDERRLFNSQTLSLQEYLRLRFNEPSILVLNQNNQSSNIYLFWLHENQAKTHVFWLSESAPPKYIYWLHELDSMSWDFCIQVPSSLQPALDEIRSIVDVMKLAGKRYKVTFV